MLIAILRGMLLDIQVDRHTEMYTVEYTGR